MTARPQVVALFFLLAAAERVAAVELERRYFKEALPLRLDTARVAVRLEEGAGRSRVAAALASETWLAAERAEPMAISGWWLVPVARTAKLDDEGLLQRSARLAASGAVSFVTPVFVDRFGGPLVPTPTLLLRFEADVPRARREEILNELAPPEAWAKEWSGLAGAYRLSTGRHDGAEALRWANELALRPEIRFAELDWIFTGRGDLIPDDTLFGLLWGLDNTGQSGGTVDVDIDGPEAWDQTLGDPEIKVAVIDTGVQQDHPDINQWPGYDVTSDAGDGGPINSCDNHGTPVAGCISATLGNGLGVAGIAPGVRVVSIRTFISTTPTCDGSWTTLSSWTVDALAQAEAIGARVTNNSNGYGAYASAAIEDKYSTTRSGGIVHFASAGNDGVASLHYPASLSSVNAVAAIDRTGAKWAMSNYGTGLDFAAPGVTIYTTDRTGDDGYLSGDYIFINGTSFATPYAAGIAALLLSKNPTLTPGLTEAALQLSASDLGAPGYDTTFGWGLVNADLALFDTPAVCDDDGFEAQGSGNSNDVCFGTALSVGSLASAALCDEDWYYFAASAGVEFRIDTFQLLGGANTVISLYSNCGDFLSFNDDSHLDLSSTIVWTADSGGSLDIRVSDAVAFGQSKLYVLTVTCLASCADEQIFTDGFDFGDTLSWD